MAEIDLSRAYWLDGPGRPHRAEGSTGSISRADIQAQGRYRTLMPSRCRAAGVPYGTPATDPRCVPHDPHRAAAQESGARADGSGQPSEGPESPPPAASGPGPEPAGKDRGPARRARHEPGNVHRLRALPPAPDLPPREGASPRDPEPDEDELGGEDWGFDTEEVPPSGGTDGAADAGGEHHSECPRDEDTFWCAGCGRTYARVSEEQATKAAEVVLGGVAKGVLAGAAVGAGAEPKELLALMTGVHAPVHPEHAIEAGKILRPILMRAGGSSRLIRAVGNVGAFIGFGVMTAMGAHDATKCEGCRVSEAEGEWKRWAGEAAE